MENTLCDITPDPPLLIETFAWTPPGGACRIALHRDRMAHSAQQLGFVFDPTGFDRLVITLAGPDPLRCRLTLSQSGDLDLTTSVLMANPSHWRLAIAAPRLDPADPWLRHKTTRRAQYDTARARLPAGVDELLFLNHQGDLCEGTISTLFLRRSAGTRWLTPSLSCGLLPGVLRQHLLARGLVDEAILSLADLNSASQLAVGNSLRGLLPVKLVAT